MNIFVARLNYDTNEDSLRDAFQQYGSVDSVKIIQDRDTGRSKGYGFVEMSDDDEAQSAIEGLNNSELDGRTIVVRESDDRGQRQSRGPRREFKSNRY